MKRPTTLNSFHLVPFLLTNNFIFLAFHLLRTLLSSPCSSKTLLLHLSSNLSLPNYMQYGIEAYELPPIPFVVLSWYMPGTIPSSPDILFCPINYVPSPEAICSVKCPLILAPNTFRDIKVEHYGVVIGRLSEFFLDIDPKAIVPHPINYP